MKRCILTMCLPLALASQAAWAELPAEDVTTLPALNIDIGQSSVSGISSGGYMAQQFHTAYSDLLMGVGIVAGGPYYCAENSVTIALTRCMDPTEADPPDPARLAWLTQEFAKNGHVADPTHMAEDRVWLFSSPADGTVRQPVMDTLKTYYQHFVAPERITYVNDIPAAHSMVTEDYGHPCNHVGDGNNPDDHFINDCDYDAAGEVVKHLYERVHHPSDTLSGRFIRFPQAEFIEAPTSHGMDEHAYAYIPQICDRGGRCRVHVVLHGCRQYHARIGEVFFRYTGYNEWADSNRIVLLYPQTLPTLSQSNGNGCWDWWGYDDAHYMWRNGRQMQALKGMIERVAGAVSETPAPASPSNVGAALETDLSLTLSWDPVDDPQVSGYMVYRSQASGGPYLAATATLITEPRLTLTNLALGEHYFVIVAINHEGIESVPTPQLAVTLPGL